MAIAYAWKPTATWKKLVDADTARRCIDDIAEEFGRARPADIVEKARDAAHPLHPVFDWDDTTAAEKYRLDQAARIVNHLVIVDDARAVGAEPVRAFVHIYANDGDGEGGYESLFTVLSDGAKRHQMLSRALRELEGWQRRYADLTEFSELHQAIEKVKRKGKRLNAQPAQVSP